MKKITLFSILIVIMSCSKSKKTHKVNSSKFDSNKIERIDAVFNSMKNDGFTGGILVAEKGDIIYSGTYGSRNLIDSLHINENTMFELASVSKQFTAAGIALLEQQGRIDIKQPVSSYIAELDEYKEITIEHLIHHTSGLPEYDEGDWSYDRAEFITNDSLINYLSRVKPSLLFKSGTKYKYSNTGYVILASIIERVTKVSFGEFLKKNIFDVADMSRTRIYRSRYKPELIENYGVGFVYSDSLKKNVIPDLHNNHDYIVHLDGIQGDGMVNSTLLDLLKWDRLLYSDKIFTKKTIQKLFTSNQLSDGTQNDYGYGWRIEKDELFGTVVSHSGGWPGYVTFIERYLDTDKTIIILQNNYNNFDLNTKMLRAILHKNIIPKSAKKDFIGKYEFEDDKTVLTIRAKEDNLIGEYDGDTLNLIQIKERIFFIKNQQSVQVEFVKDSTKKISRAKWHQGDYVGDLKRIE